ncbi:hypothetical protein PHYC_03555 [Phycisphaerales bacterium]|nr:hypothetical protein PHYC_03555 [Phycisphaerales bacterium]
MVMRLLGDVGDLEYGRKPGWFGDDPKYQIAIHPPRDWTLQPGDFHSISIQLSWYRTSDDPCFRIEAENWVFVPGPSHPGDSGGGYHSAWKKDTKGVTEDELKAALRELLQSKK